MAITYPLTMPSTGGIRAIDWKAESSVSTSESPFSKKLKVYDWGGKRHSALVSIAPMTISDAKQWVAFFLKLNGLVGTFWLTPTLDKDPSGVATGTPLVKGGSQTGQSLVSDGWTANTTGILKEGDWIQVGDYLYRNLNDVDSDPVGAATLDIWPNLRSSPADNAPITVASPKGIFRLAEMPPFKIDANLLCPGFKFEVIEAI